MGSERDAGTSTLRDALGVGAEADLLLDAALTMQAFSGWDFGALTRTGRMVEAPLPWSFGSLALPAVRRARALLDMGTGGGELLASLAPLPPGSHATEAWPPNVPLAQARLAPLGVQVHAIADDLSVPLPLAAGSVDLVLNRHEAYAPEEVARVLQPGGLFITQQVGGDNDAELHALLEADAPRPFAHWRLEYALEELLSVAGEPFDLLDAREAQVVTRFYDVGAIAWYLSAMPWELPDFSVEAYRARLHAVHAQIRRTGWLDVTCHRFLIVARRVDAAGVAAARAAEAVDLP